MTDAAPTLGAIPMVGDSSSASGAAFELDKPAWRDATAEIEGWEIEVRKGLKLVVARGGSDPTFGDVYSSGLLRAQQGLDLLSAQGAGDLSIYAFDDAHVVWWRAPDLIVRVVSISTIEMRVGPVQISVRDADGNAVPPTPHVPPTWHESFRYYRLSQTTDDLFDAYRNAYLALESILSDIAPQKLRANGGPDEGEGEWFARALRAADGVVALSTFVPAGTVDPHQHLFKELYIDMRSGMSHAKSGRQVLLPRDEAERNRVTESLRRLVTLYLKLVEEHLGLRRLGGFVFAVAFRRAYESKFEDMSVFASDEESELDPSQTALNPAGGELVELGPVEPVNTRESFLVTRLFAASAAKLDRLPFVRRVGAVDPDGQALFGAVLEGRLVLGPATRLEAVLGIRGVNTGRPRLRYSF